MKIGVIFINIGSLGEVETLTQLAATAEACGIESLWAIEHVVFPKGFQTPYPYSRDGRFPSPEEVPILDPLIALSYLAGVTKRIKFGTGIIILPQRNPLVLAKEVATLDYLSQGRMMLGIGSGWLKEEFDALGIDFASRGARTNEAIGVLRALWREPVSSFHGKHFNFDSVCSFPKPARSAGVPIHIGGHSAVAARRAARLGDGFFPGPGRIEVLKGLFDEMRAECARIGRNPAEIELSAGGRSSLDHIRRLEDLGVTRTMLSPQATDHDGIRRELEEFGNQIVARL